MDKDEVNQETQQLCSKGEFLDATTNTCASCALICGAGGHKRTKFCLQEPNCRGLDGVWDCANSKCNATCESPTTKAEDNSLRYEGMKKCVCLFNVENEKIGGQTCKGSPWMNCSRDIEDICHGKSEADAKAKAKATQAITIPSALGVLVLLVMFVVVAGIYRSRIAVFIRNCLQRLKRPHISIPEEDPENNKNAHEAIHVHSPQY